MSMQCACVSGSRKWSLAEYPDISSSCNHVRLERPQALGGKLRGERGGGRAVAYRSHAEFCTSCFSLVDRLDDSVRVALQAVNRL